MSKPQGETIRANITGRKDWFEAFKVAADEAGVSMSSWLMEAGVAFLPKKVQKQLSPPPIYGRQPPERYARNGPK